MQGPRNHVEGTGSRLVEALRSSDEYKEDSRSFRRTVFSNDDWIKFRSSGRLYNNLGTMFTSGIIRGLWLEVGTVFMVALGVFIANNALSGVDLASYGLPKDFRLVLPQIPFSLSSPALALLLVFRTNTVYARWNEARTAWGRIESACCNLARQGVTYLRKDLREEHIRRVCALAHALNAHFWPGEEGAERAAGGRMAELLGRGEARRLMAAGHVPTQALSDISRVVRRCDVIDGSTKSRFDLHLDELSNAIVTCERLIKTPVPLVYTRHAGRFLALWVLLLPFALAGELDSNFLMVPISTLVAVFFFGIEELGIQIEEPFSIMPLDDVVLGIDQRLCQMLDHDVSLADQPIGPDASPLAAQADGAARGGGAEGPGGGLFG